MKKLILIALLIVGCEKDTPTESSVHPLVGIWNVTEVTVTEGSVSQTMTIEGNDSATIIFSADNTASITSTFDGETNTDSSTWSVTGNYITVITDGDTEIWTYSISGNILTLIIEEAEDGVTTVLEYKCEKQ